MKKFKAMAQKIWKISILYPKTSKEFYRQIEFWKSIMRSRCSLKKMLKIISQYSQENTCVSSISFLIKKRPTTLWKRDYIAGVFLVILSNFYEHLFWRTSVNGCFWEFFLLCHSLNHFLHEQITKQTT